VFLTWSRYKFAQCLCNRLLRKMFWVFNNYCLKRLTWQPCCYKPSKTIVIVRTLTYNSFYRTDFAVLCDCPSGVVCLKSFTVLDKQDFFIRI